MSIFTRSLALLTFFCAALRGQNPTLQSFLAGEASNRAQIYAGLQSRTFPAPAFGAQLMALNNVACGYLQISAGQPCIFLAPQAQYEVDLLAQNPPAGLGVSVIQINFDPYWLIDNSAASVSARGVFKTVMSYIYSTYGAGSSHKPIVQVRLEPAYTTGNVGPACNKLTNGVTPMVLTSPTQLATCVTTTSFNTSPGHCGGAQVCGSWLITPDSVQHSVYGWIAAFYGPNTLTGAVPVMTDVSDIHEPTTINGTYAWGTPTQAVWQGAVNTMITTTPPAEGTFDANSLVNNGIAFDRFELQYATGVNSMLPLNNLVYVGGDEYTTDITNNAAGTGGGMGSLALILAAASALKYRTLFTESWLPSWSPAGGSPTDENAFEGTGNCDWQTFDLIRQTLMATSMWASANGLSEVNFFSAANTSTICVYGGIGNGNDKLVNAGSASSYLPDVAAATVSSTQQRTKTFYWLQQLMNNWMAVVTSGQQLPI